MHWKKACDILGKGRRWQNLESRPVAVLQQWPSFASSPEDRHGLSEACLLCQQDVFVEFDYVPCRKPNLVVRCGQSLGWFMNWVCFLSSTKFPKVSLVVGGASYVFDPIKRGRKQNPRSALLHLGTPARRLCLTFPLVFRLTTYQF
jgi:hypothetical protein